MPPSLVSTDHSISIPVLAAPDCDNSQWINMHVPFVPTFVYASELAPTSTPTPAPESLLSTPLNHIGLMSRFTPLYLFH